MAARLARAARDAGLMALERGERDAAVRWLDRAHRLVPDDPHVALSLATACLGHDDARAAVLFRESQATHDSREARLGLAAACAALGDSAGAADSLRAALSQHALAPGMESLVSDLAHRAGFVGWCGVRGTGEVVVTATRREDVEVRLDGRRIEATTAVLSWNESRWLTAEIGADHLVGSPLDVAAIARSLGHAGRELRESPGVPAMVPATDRPDKSRPIAIVIPIQGDRPAAVMAGVNSVLAGTRGAHRIVVVDDGNTDLSLISALDQMASARRIDLIRHDRPLGFAASANAGIAAHPDHDIVLLRGDVLVPPGWLGRLRNAAYRKSTIGSVTPLSNDAGFLRCAAPEDRAAAPDLALTTALDGLAKRAHRVEPVEIPTGIGFCLYLKRACLDATGPLRADLFTRGAGADIDFCLRAGRLGWLHVALPSLFVGCQEATPPAGAVNDRKILARLHPDDTVLPWQFGDADPLADARRRLDLGHWHASRALDARSVILITHNSGGGVERRIAAAADQYRRNGLRAIVVRPAPGQGGLEAVSIGDGPNGGYASLRFELPREMPGVLRLLRASDPQWIEVHHILDQPTAVFDLVRRLSIPYDVHLHDYIWICPRIALVGHDGRYCGEPDLTSCERCITDRGSLIRESIGVGALRRRSGRFLAAARHVYAPSQDTATRMRRYFPALPIAVVPHDDDPTLFRVTRAEVSEIARVCVAGTIGPHKGYDIVLACARDARQRRLHLEFVVVGDTTDDEALLSTGRAFITGTYHSAEAVTLIRAQSASIGFLPSVWPETWSLTLSEMWRAGLPVAAFDLGAPAERIRASGKGIVLPLGLPPAAINDALLAAMARPVHEWSSAGSE